MNSHKNIFRSHGFGKVAPWVDLVNSQEWDGFGNLSDRLDDPRWLTSFLRHWKLPPPPGERAPLSALKGLRTLLRRLTEKLPAATPFSPTETRELNSAMSVAAYQKLVQRQNSYRIELAPVRSDWNWVLAKIAASAAETLAAPQSARIKICANNDCRWLFYDPTKARTKRWCSDKTCGNRDRVRRARAAK
jgi:predicted RNA-binding Zn ribbon-like protein